MSSKFHTGEFLKSDIDCVDIAKEGCGVRSEVDVKIEYKSINL